MTIKNIWNHHLDKVISPTNPTSKKLLIVEVSPRIGNPKKPKGEGLYEPGSKLPILGMVIPSLIGNPYNGYINPYHWVDDHPPHIVSVYRSTATNCPPKRRFDQFCQPRHRWSRRPPGKVNLKQGSWWTTLPETNIAMENLPFWWYLPGKMGFSWAMLVSGRVPTQTMHYVLLMVQKSGDHHLGCKNPTNGRSYLSTGAGFQPSTVLQGKSPQNYHTLFDSP